MQPNPRLATMVLTGAAACLLALQVVPWTSIAINLGGNDITTTTYTWYSSNDVGGESSTQSYFKGDWADAATSTKIVRVSVPALLVGTLATVAGVILLWLRKDLGRHVAMGGLALAILGAGFFMQIMDNISQAVLELSQIPSGSGATITTSTLAGPFVLLAVVLLALAGTYLGRPDPALVPVRTTRQVKAGTEPAERVERAAKIDALTTPEGWTPPPGYDQQTGYWRGTR